MVAAMVIKAKPGNTVYNLRLKAQGISIVIENSVPCSSVNMVTVDENHAKALIQKGGSILKYTRETGKAEKEV